MHAQQRLETLVACYCGYTGAPTQHISPPRVAVAARGATAASAANGVFVGAWLGGAGAIQWRCALCAARKGAPWGTHSTFKCHNPGRPPFTISR